jgi:hypothetical protein
MGKIFIADEVDDSHTADVTVAGKVKVETGAATYGMMAGNGIRLATNGTATAFTTVPTYLKKIILGSKPATSTWLSVYDCDVTVSGNNLSAFGSSGANIVSRLYLDSSAGLCANSAKYPCHIDMDVYLASGLCMTLGEGQTFSVLSGCCSGLTVVYQT